MAQLEAAGQVVNKATNTARDAAGNPVTTGLARAGYAAKGLVYVIIGGLAAKAAIGDGGATTDREGALKAIYEQPFGKILLALVAIGLIGYALWRVLDAVADLEHKGTKPKGLATRAVYVGAGLSYAILAVAALSLVMGTGNGGKGSDANAQDWTARLLAQPFGMVLVIIGGLIFVGVGLYQFYKAYKAKFRDDLALSGVGARMSDAVVWIGRLGFAARGVVFSIIGIFLIIAALRHDQNQAKGLGGALQELAQQPFGLILLGVVALGLVAYGLFSLVEARYRQAIENAENAG